MRVVAIGLGGAGCRMVDTLYAKDRKFGKVICLDAIAVDRDSDVLAGLSSMPDMQKLFFPSMDPRHPDDILENITIEEIIEKIQRLDTGDLDAILFCMGLGGTMAEAAPRIIQSIRKVMVEPVFGLFTLPCVAEGEQRTVRAADDLDLLNPMLDGIIIFDNEIWYPKAGRLLSEKKESVNRSFVPGSGKVQPDRSLHLRTFDQINDLIAQRFGLLLRAGEFHESPGRDVGEVVLDTGEVLNTMRGMGFIALGYATEEVVKGGFEFIRHFKLAGTSFEDSHTKAIRLVSLAKRAVYEEISVQCDLSTAEKGLILIAGPTHEISMKGSMTVRKWIDRSIAGREVRSGDYPLSHSRYVAILILLAGVRPIPRIDEIRKIRDQGKSVANP
jgi:cell division GTPase FtsZ